MMQEVARGQPNGLAAFDNGADDVGSQEGITDCLAHAVRWDGVFGGNLLIGFACFDSVEPGEGVGDIAQECAVDGFRGVAQNELGLDAASTQAERCEDAECLFSNAFGSHREASSERIAVEQDGHRAGADVDPPDKTEQGGCRGCAFYLFIRAPQLDRSPVYRDHACMISSLVRARPLAQPQTQTLSY